ncbi:hypothetical protein NDU88_002320 [Pleurodeles waltl]|uniref:Uncharacterized protein n=1 Tax=Pleurodeles waltl TaxID=8319 RepID=A0AAV7VCX3_PLEWA|nr:hypothetical protein NDU88_002320 [Pleurodeles waltl]
MDRMSDRLDKHAECLDQAERRLSEVEDDQVMIWALQKEADKLLAALQAKEEYFEARSKWINLCIVGVAQSFNINNMERLEVELAEVEKQHRATSDQILLATLKAKLDEYHYLAQSEINHQGKYTVAQVYGEGERPGPTLQHCYDREGKKA